MLKALIKSFDNKPLNPQFPKGNLFIARQIGSRPISWGDSPRESDREPLYKLDEVERTERIGFRMEAPF